MADFKIGDRVRCIKGDNPHKDFKPGGMGWELGLEFVIGELTNDGIAWGSGTVGGNGVYTDWLELATEPVSTGEPQRKLGTWEVSTHG